MNVDAIEALINELEESAIGWDECGKGYAYNAGLDRRSAAALKVMLGALKAGPSGWLYERGHERHASCDRMFKRHDWNEIPLYFIPAPEPKP